ncbi:MAG: hypothetical protein NTU95_09065 [Methanothrix sp.]|nr:hypothetical protein [Methanothrix sp.]
MKPLVLRHPKPRRQPYEGDSRYVLKRNLGRLKDKGHNFLVSPEWIRICPACRRSIEAERATRLMALGRSRKSP